MKVIPVLPEMSAEAARARQLSAVVTKTRKDGKALSAPPSNMNRLNNCDRPIWLQKASVTLAIYAGLR